MFFIGRYKTILHWYLFFSKKCLHVRLNIRLLEQTKAWFAPGHECSSCLKCKNAIGQNTRWETNCFVRQETNRTGNSKIELAVAKKQANKQGQVKKLLGVDRPQGTSHWGSKQVSQVMYSQVSTSMKYQQLIVYLFPSFFLCFQSQSVAINWSLSLFPFESKVLVCFCFYVGPRKLCNFPKDGLWRLLKRHK